MVMTDPIADMLTRIRNALNAKFEKVDIPSSKIKLNIASILKKEGFIKNYELIDNKHPIIRIFLKYDEKKRPIISELKRISKPGLRIYVKKEDIPRVKRGVGIAILSTSKGILTDREARKQGVGGELLCIVW